MTTYIAQRLASAVPVLVGVSILVFAMLHLVPGDPVTVMLGQGGASSEQAERVREELGLKDPLYVQYLRFISRAAVGDFGRSIRSNVPVSEVIAAQLPSTLELAVSAMLLAAVLGVGMGMLSAYRHNSWLDTATMLIAMLGVSTPSFWLGLVLLFVFGVQLGWVPITGQGGLVRLALPAITLGFVLAAPIARMTRSSLLDVLNKEYMRTARAKGLRAFRLAAAHALPNALVPVVTVLGLQFGWLLGGTVIIEQVFARQGLGNLIVTAILNRDFPVVQAAVLLMAVTFVLINLLVDLMQVWLDPRVRYR